MSILQKKSFDLYAKFFDFSKLMADDDDAPPPPSTVEELFYLYSKVNTLPQYSTNEAYDTILLSQIDIWFEKAELLKVHITMTDTGTEYLRFK